MPFILGKTIPEIFLKRAALTPDLVGFQYKANHKWHEVTYRKFLSDVRTTSFGLMSLNIHSGDRVAILAKTRYEWSVCDMAILGCGAITVPIYASSTVEDICYILNHCEAKCLIVEEEADLKKILKVRSENPSSLASLEKIVVLDWPEPAIQSDNALSFADLHENGKTQELKDPTRFESNLNAAKPTDTLSIVYTSGTTGTPKGAVITQDNMVNVLEDCVAALSDFVDADSEVILSFLPFAHIVGKVESMAGYTFGWKQAFAENIDKLLTDLTEIHPTILFSVPRTFEKAYAKIHSEAEQVSVIKKRLFRWAMASGERYFASIRKRKMPNPRDITEYMLAKKLVFSKITRSFGGRLRFVLCGGAPLSRELGEFFQITGIKILEGYGLTETCGPISINTPDDVRFGTVGRPLPEVSVRTADDGEIEVHSKKLFSSYYKSPFETAEALQDGWFKTGDIGFIDSDGFIHITDRKKDIIITAGGKNIAPQRLEALAKSHSWINQIVIVGDRKPYITAILTLNRELVIQTASEKGILFSEYAELIKNSKILAMTQQIIERINTHLAQFETIKKFTILPNEFTVASGELSPSLKIKRKVIVSRYKTEIESLYS